MDRALVDRHTSMPKHLCGPNEAAITRHYTDNINFKCSVTALLLYNVYSTFPLPTNCTSVAGYTHDMHQAMSCSNGGVISHDDFLSPHDQPFLPFMNH